MTRGQGAAGLAAAVLVWVAPGATSVPDGQLPRGTFDGNGYRIEAKAPAAASLVETLGVAPKVPTVAPLPISSASA